MSADDLNGPEMTGPELEGDERLAAEYAMGLLEGEELLAPMASTSNACVATPGRQEAASTAMEWRAGRRSSRHARRKSPTLLTLPVVRSTTAANALRRHGCSRGTRPSLRMSDGGTCGGGDSGGVSGGSGGEGG